MIRMTTVGSLMGMGQNDLAAFDKAILITGGYGGIGAEAARLLHATHPDALIIVAGRNANKAQAFAASCPPNVAGAKLDLASLPDVGRFALEYNVLVSTGVVPPLSALICNAGTQAGPGEMRVSEDGFEETFAVNHLAHMHLTLALLPSFANRARLIVVSSGTHDPNTMEGRFNKPILRNASVLANPLDPQTRNTNAIVRYSTSKLCNLLFAYEFARRAHDLAPNKVIDVLTYDPGGVPGSDLMRNINPLTKRILTAPWLMRLLRVTTRTPKDAGRYLAALLTQDVDHEPAYWQGPNRSRSSKTSLDPEHARALWDGSETLIQKALRLKDQDGSKNFLDP
ncbi:SDR family NAD(P)-dependent oxidoreductase [Tateyamaria omphalii]|uniref:SDR family NAD(P)-dependent oxidoreductase n=1 Tax=Tateyamaria omphalii TaxID=299262 RepID=UPI001C9A0DC2|nr:SDR family NAD(P)-dependent oxidoreductase [Tateyamaria omphalii]MBY5932571.1 SDR family NAD(P)-dependent oxidoreductase [Tateyamaria omphalii]